MCRVGILEAYLSAKPRLNDMSFAEFESETKDFIVNPVFHNNNVIGAILVKDAELHCCILPDFKGKWLKRCYIEILNDIIRKHGKATTHASTKMGHQFVQRFGFKQVGDHYERSELWELKR